MSGTSFELKNEVVRAGAGAGKTTELTRRILDYAAHFYAQNSKFPHVVATTFTRKATQELRERLMMKALERDPRLLGFVNSKSHLLVSTIHGILDLYLKRYGRSVGLDPGYSLLSGFESDRLSRRLARDTLFSSSDSDFWLENFKFTEIAHYLNSLVRLKMQDQGLRPYSTLDFQAVANLQWNEVKSAICDFVEEVTADIESYEPEVQRLHIELKGFLNQIRSTDAAESYVILQKEWPLFSRPLQPRKKINTSARHILQRLEELTESTFDPQVWQKYTDAFARFQVMAEQYQADLWREKKRLGILDIEDLELLSLQCMRQFPETAQAFSEEWDHWLIDEYQDTSPIQVELLQHLVGAKPHFVVGDPQQSIYLFRGAREEVFTQKQESVLASGGVLRSKEHNYRSRPSLLFFFNDFFAGLQGAFMPMKPHPEWLDEPSKEPVAHIFAASTEEDELSHLAAQIVTLLKSGVQPQEICILARRNKALAEVASYLDQYNLPLQLHSSRGFYERREIKDALALLKFLVNPHDNTNLVLLLRSPWFQVLDEQIAQVTKTKPASFWSAFCQTSQTESIRRLQEWQSQSQQVGCVQTFKEALVQSGFIDLSQQHDVTGRRESNIWKLISRLEAEVRKPGFNPLRFIAVALSDLRSLEESDEADAVAAVEPNRINLMTVHSSKGLEFKHVFLPFMGRSIRKPPSQNFVFDEDASAWGFRLPDQDEKKTRYLAEVPWLQKIEERESAEQLRLLYVAFTRASHAIHLSWLAPAEKDSWASLLRFSTEPGLHEKPQYSYFVHTDALVLTEWNSSASAVSTVRKMWQLPSRAPQEVGSVSVTELVKKAGAAQVLQPPQILSRSRAALRGVATHRLLEILKYPSREQIPQLIERWFRGSETEIAGALTYLSDLQDPPVLRLIQEGQVEWSFALKRDDQIIEGQIDLWGLDSVNKKWWVVDYKTGQPERKDEAFAQMRLYAEALRRAGLSDGPGDSETIHLGAVYPFSQKIFTETF